MPIIRPPDFAPTINGLTAFGGGGQANGTLLAYAANIFTTVAAPADSALLPTGGANRSIWVQNNGANAMNIFPAVGLQIGSLGVNTALSVPAGKSALFVDLGGAYSVNLSA